MKNRITTLFKSKNSNILSIFYTAGFPALDNTVDIANILANEGVDIIEIGIPFSDPIADGPTIQSSSHIALNNGMNLKLLLEQVKTIRNTNNIPIILMGYVNTVLQFGVEKFCVEASACGVDGVIFPDLPLEEYLESYEEHFQKNNLSNIFLVSPTTSKERINKIDTNSNSFIYAVSRSSITGGKNDFGDDQKEYLMRLKSMKLKNPFLVGFGISNKETFSVACKYATGVIIGSAFIDCLKNKGTLESNIHKFVKGIKE